jgi:hypothetical protein
MIECSPGGKLDRQEGGWHSGRPSHARPGQPVRPVVRAQRRSSLAAVTPVAVVAAMFGLVVWPSADMRVNQGPQNATVRIQPGALAPEGGRREQA